MQNGLGDVIVLVVRWFGDARFVGLDRGILTELSDRHPAIESALKIVKSRENAYHLEIVINERILEWTGN